MPILEKKGITVKDYMKERLLYTGWSPDTFLRMCRSSLENKKNFTIIDGTTEFTIPIDNLYEYFAPKVEEIEHKPEAMDVAPIEEEPIEKPKPKPKAKKVKAKKK